MGLFTVTCPQCLARVEVDPDVKYCPRCGRDLPAIGSAEAAAPLELSDGGLRVIVRDRFAFGNIANLYCCSINDAAPVGVFKVARTATANKHVVREAATLARLHAADAAGRFVPFLPRVAGSITYASPPEEPQRANVLAYHAGIDSPHELYTLEEVRAAHPDGLDARDMAWVWRRLLTVLGFVHEQRTVHTAVTPDHVLIEPREHKLVLVGWCAAVHTGQPTVLSPPTYEEWRSGGDGSIGAGASPADDLRAASRTMSYLLGESGSVEPAIIRHLERAGEATGSSANAWRLLDDFDRMIEALWGPRRFRTFTMPPRPAARS